MWVGFSVYINKPTPTLPTRKYGLVRMFASRIGSRSGFILSVEILFGDLIINNYYGKISARE